MAAAAVFLLIANDGKADRMIMATQLLNQRIKDIMMARRQAGKSDMTPTLVDIERTHLLYVNAHFKPYAAIAYEYNKVRPQTGGINFGNSMQFSIPQFGDFFFDMVVNIVLPQVTGTQVSFPTAASLLTPSFVGRDGDGKLITELKNHFTEVVFKKLDSGHVIKGHDTPHGGKHFPSGTVSVGYRHQFVDAFGIPLPTDKADGSAPDGIPTVPVNNLVRYCEYPGNFLFPNVKFDVNGNPLDSYSNKIPTIYQKMQLSPNKRWGYNTLNGQQNAKTGIGSLFTANVVDQEYQSPTSQIIGGIINGHSKSQIGQEINLHNFLHHTPATANRALPIALNARPAKDLLNPVSADSAQTSIGQKQFTVLDGPQTPKPTQPPLSLWIPLHFWFNSSISLAIPSVSIPFGQRYITISTADTQSSNNGNLFYQSPGVYVKKTLFYNSKNPIADLFHLDDADTSEVEYAPWGGENTGLVPGWLGLEFPPQISNGLSVTSPISSAELYINNIFVNPEIHDIYIKRIGFSLIRVYREQNTSLSGQGNSEILLSALKWPIEFMFVALQPTWNTSSSNANAWRDWHRFSKNISAYPNSLLTGNSYTESVPLQNGSQTVTSTFTGQNSVQPEQYWIPAQTTDYLSIISHGITIYDNFPSIFYNAYLPYKYNEQSWITPEDNSLLFITFCLFPGLYQPSGHLNISRARETYVNISSSYVSSNGKSNFSVTAVAINFLLISDGSAVLRYST